MPLLDLDSDSDLDQLSLLSLAIIETDLKSFLKTIIEAIPRLIGARDVSIWLANKTSGSYEIFMTDGQRNSRPESALAHTLNRHTVFELHHTIARVTDIRLPWESKPSFDLACQLYSSGRALGAILFHFDQDPTIDPERALRTTTRLVSYICRALDQIERASMTRALNDVLSRITEAETISELVKCLLEGGFTITDSGIGAVLLLNAETGGLDVSLHNPIIPRTSVLSMEGGITDKCLGTCRPRRLGNTYSNPIFREFWPGMYSELAVPLFVPNSSARLPNPTGSGSHLEDKPKRIGVLNFESPLPDAFSEAEEACVMQLARSASVVFDRLQFQESLRKLHSAESDMAMRLVAGHDWREDLQAVASHIRATLACSHVSISAVSLDGRRIRSEYISWSRPKEDSDKYMQMSDHDLGSSKDILADVVRTRQIEVPDTDDPRFHPGLHRSFHLDTLIRAYLPVIMGEVIVGTLEVGYPRKFRQFMFERDIQVLKTLADYVAAVIWKRRRGHLDVLRHEIAAPRRAIMDNAIFLMRHWQSLPSDKIARKLSDIVLDGEAIDYLVDKIEYFATGRSKDTKVEEVHNIGAVVISKTIFQQSRKLRSFGADTSKISFKADVKMVAHIDKVKLAAVFNNLLDNAIKYRVSDESFRIEITAESRADKYLIRVADFGIGVDPESTTKLFEPGYRSPIATQSAIGSGLGLSISRDYMREMGGDLLLANAKNPTVFLVVITKVGRR